MTRTTFEARRATVTAYVFRPGARFPVHHHPQEQITVVQRGHVEMTVGDEVHALSAGEWSVVAPGVEHGVMAGPDGAELLAVIVPRREHPDAYDLAGGEAATR